MLFVVLFVVLFVNAAKTSPAGAVFIIVVFVGSFGFEALFRRRRGLN